MKTESQKYIYNKSVDLWFIRFPILFPIIYTSLLYIFPNYENYLIIATIILLAEPHFGATWSIFFNKSNYQYYNRKPNIFYIGSFAVVFFSILGFFYFQNLFFLLFYGFNIYHVTMQSIGVCKLYNKKTEEIQYQTSFIFISNILFFFFGLFRFYIPIINNQNIFLLSSFTIILILIIFIYQLYKYRSLSNSLTTLTGSIIFLPILFVDKPIHAILLGVTMHYSQYIFISSKVYFGRNNNLSLFKDLKFTKLLKSKLFAYLAIYGLVMGFFTSFNQIGNEITKNLILIPLIGQMLHFYLDGFLWKFSEPHNREQTLKYLFKEA